METWNASIQNYSSQHNWLTKLLNNDLCSYLGGTHRCGLSNFYGGWKGTSHSLRRHARVKSYVCIYYGCKIKKIGKDEWLVGILFFVVKTIWDEKNLAMEIRVDIICVCCWLPIEPRSGGIIRSENITCLSDCALSASSSPVNKAPHLKDHFPTVKSCSRSLLVLYWVVTEKWPRKLK